MDKEKTKRYNSDWTVTSYKIRVERANNQCEKCGLQNGIYIKRAKNGHYRHATQEEMTKVEYWHKIVKVKLAKAIKQIGLTKVVLTVAHLNHNERDDRPENLLCMCQRCHIMHDKADNRLRAIRYKSAKQNSQIKLF